MNVPHDQSRRNMLGPLEENPVSAAVVFLMNSDFSTGGTERQFALLARALRSSVFPIELGCMRRRGAFIEGFEDIAEFDVGGSFFTWQAQRARFALARHLRALRVAVAHSFDFYSNLMLIPVARLAGVPVVIGSRRYIGNLLTPLERGAATAMYLLCDRVVCNSQAAARDLSSEGFPDEKLVVIPNGLPDEAFAEAAPALPRDSGTTRIGLVARMNHPVKNQPLFLKAAARLVNKFPNAEFLLIGDGALRAGLERLANQLRLGNRIRFLGERHDMAAVLASLDISVVTSSSESQSNVILESMAAGKPVVATRVGGNPELVGQGETGYLFPANDEDGLVEVLEHLLTQPSLRIEMGRRAKQLACANFSLGQVRKQYEALYGELLERKSWRPAPPKSLPRRAADSPRPIRLAIVAPSLRYVGGQAVQADLLLRNWREDPAVDVSFIPIDPDLPQWVQGIPFLRTLVRTPLYLMALWRGLRNVDIAHIFSASYWSFMLAPVPALLVAQSLGRKTVINYHSAEARDHLKRWKIALPFLRRAGQLVVPSKYLVDVFEQYGLPARIVPNVIDLSQFSFRVRAPLKPLLICTRTFEPYYRVDLVVRSYAVVKEKFPQARLCLVGSGSLEKEIRSLASELKLTDIEFAGAVDRDQIGRFYDRADIFINASSLDNMPVSILEAFAAGTPVVTAAAEGIRYFVDHERTGLLSDVGDWRALAQNVIRLLQEPELARFLAANAHQESTRYHWENVRGKWLGIYQSLLTGKVDTSDIIEVPPRENSLAAHRK